MGIDWAQSPIPYKYKNKLLQYLIKFLINSLIKNKKFIYKNFKNIE